MSWHDWSEIRWILLGWFLAVVALTVALRYLHRWQQRHDPHDTLPP